MTNLSDTVQASLKYWWVYLVSGLLYLFTSFYIFRFPVEGYIGLAYFFGLIILVSGIFQLIFSLINRDHMNGWVWQLLWGIIEAFIGIVLLSNMSLTMATLPWILGLWFFTRSFSLFSFYNFATHHQSGSRFIIITGAVINLALGLIVIFNPLFAAFTIVFLTALAFFVGGIFQLLLAVGLKQIKESLDDLG